MTTRILRPAALLLALVLVLVPFTQVRADAAFYDVADEDWYAPAVAWATEADISNGVGQGLFAPDDTITRAQIVTFLWRMAGEPSPTGSATFSDVVPGSWYESAVQWALEEGITEGTSETTFSPKADCDRAMCVTMLYRMKGSPLDEMATTSLTLPTGEDERSLTLEELAIYLVQLVAKDFEDPERFSDVEADAYYKLPMVWGILNDILTLDNTGITGEFPYALRPHDPCTRAEMVSFMYQTKLAIDAANAPVEYVSDNLILSIPQACKNLVYVTVHGPDDNSENSENNFLFTVQEKGSVDAARAAGESDDALDGIGELFRIGRVSAERLHELLCGDMSGMQVFAKDADGQYYVFYHPTDVRYYRASAEEMTQDQEIWTAVNEWAWNDVRDELIARNDFLTAAVYGNLDIQIYLARTAWSESTAYTLTGADGARTGDAETAATFVSQLLENGTCEALDSDSENILTGDPITLTIAEGNICIDFYADDYARLRSDTGSETLFRLSLSDGTAYAVLQSWYDALA